METELQIGRRIVDSLNAALKRVLLREPVKGPSGVTCSAFVQRGHAAKEVATGNEVQQTVLNGSATVPDMSATTPAGPPTLVSTSPTEVVGSPTVVEKAA